MIRIGIEDVSSGQLENLVDICVLVDISSDECLENCTFRVSMF